MSKYQIHKPLNKGKTFTIEQLSFLTPVRSRHEHTGFTNRIKEHVLNIICK